MIAPIIYPIVAPQERVTLVVLFSIPYLDGWFKNMSAHRQDSLPEQVIQRGVSDALFFR
jgi:hypothetical protein